MGDDYQLRKDIDKILRDIYSYNEGLKVPLFKEGSPLKYISVQPDEGEQTDAGTIDAILDYYELTDIGQKLFDYLRKSEEIPGGADLNDYVEEGFYNCGLSMTEIANISNCPVERSFSLLVEKTNFFSDMDWGGVIQTVTRNDNVEQYKRGIWLDENNEFQSTGWKKTFGSRLVQTKQQTAGSSTPVTYTLYVDEANRHCTLTITGSNISIASGVTNYEISGFVPSDYSPKANKFCRLMRANSFLAYMWTNGTVGISNFNSSSSTGQTMSGQMDWSY